MNPVGLLWIPVVFTWILTLLGALLGYFHLNPEAILWNLGDWIFLGPQPSFLTLFWTNSLLH
jgi:hypothetical protein